jgi:hypothetical protein
MNVIQRSVIAVAISACATQAAAAQDPAPELDQNVGHWVVVDEVEYGTIYLDTAGVEVLMADVYNIRTRWIFADVQTSRDGEEYSSSVAVRVVNCQSQEMAIMAYADLNGEQVVQSAEQPLYAVYWFDVRPSPILEQIAARTCELGRQKVLIAAASHEG